MLTRQIAFIAGVILAVTLLIAVLFTGTITRRLARLTELTARVASGDFSTTASVSGSDEVADVAKSFDAMVRALQERDQEVLRIQRQMREDETKAIHQQLSKWLESDLASKLTAIEVLVEKPAPRALDLEQKHIRLRELSRDASISLQHALVFAAIAYKRVDFAQAVGEAVKLARAEVKSRVDIELGAVNAVLLPQIEGHESEIRELVERLVIGAAESTPSGGRVEVELAAKDNELLLSVKFPLSSANRGAAKRVLDDVRDLVIAHCSAASVRDHARTSAILLEFAARPD